MQNNNTSSDIECPYCGGAVPMGASKCKHCGEWLTEKPLSNTEKHYKRKEDARKTSQGCAWVLILGVFFLFYLIYQSIDSPSDTPIEQTPTSSTATPTKEEVKAITGTYQKYSFSILYTEQDKRYVATFNPFLPSNDTIVTGAMRQVVKQTYNTDEIDIISPKIVTRNEGNLIQFDSGIHKYLFLIVKEDTGAIHSFLFWRE